MGEKKVESFDFSFIKNSITFVLLVETLGDYAGVMSRFWKKSKNECRCISEIP